MAADPLTSSLQNWQKRITTAQRAGLPPSSYMELARHDLNKVMGGGQPLSDNEANIAIVSAATKSPVIHDPQRGTGPLDILGNIPSDVGGLVRGLNPINIATAIGKDAYNAVRHPSRISPFTGGALRNRTGNGLLADTAADLRATTQAPVVRLIPSLHTLAGLTTSEGRKELERHPVGTALDILPAASDVAEAATVGRAAEVGSATEALQSGRLVRGAYRAAVPDTFQELVQRTANKAGISNAIREQIARPYSVIQRKVNTDLYKFYREEVSPVLNKMPEEERQQLYREAETYKPDDPNISSEHHAILGKIREMTDSLADRGIGQERLMKIIAPNGTEHIFAATEDVAVNYRRAMGNAERVNKLMERVGRAKQALEERQAKLASRTGKVRHFMESTDAFMSRAEGPIGVQTVHEAVQPLVESFRYMDPKQVFSDYAEKILSGEMGQSAALQLSKDIGKLQGETGLFAKLDDALAAKDLKLARSSASSIARILRHETWGSSVHGTNLRTFIQDMRDEMIGLSGRERSHGYAARLVRSQERNVASAQAKLARGQEALSRHTLNYLKGLTTTVPAAFHPLVVQQIREGAADIARQTVNVQQLDGVLRTIEESPRLSDLKSAIGEQEFNKLYADATENWLSLTEQGYAPLWMHHVSRDRYERVLHATILPDRVLKPGQWEEKVFNFAPSMMDVAAAITDAAGQIIAHEGTKEFINSHVMPFTRNIADVETEIRDRLRSSYNNPRALAAAVEQEVAKEYSPFDPVRYGIGRHPGITKTNQLVLPKHIGSAIDSLMGQANKLPSHGLYAKSMNVYRFSVLTGPRHLAHVAFGGMMFMVLRDPGGLTKLRRAWNMISDGTAPVELTAGLYDIANKDRFNLRKYDAVSTDQLHGLAAGKTMGRILAEHVGDRLRAYSRVEERIAQTYKVASLLSKSARGIDRETALAEAYRTFVDLDSLAPIERIVMKQVFPFYAFTRHLFRYLLTYPVDHPYRAAILARQSEQEMEEWNTGLPTKFQQLFYLGHPDANGNVKAVETRTMNPFRSFANDFTLAGFVSSLNPILTGVMSASGMNILTATPELYPQLSYDTDTGALKAKRPSNAGLTFLEAFVPEIGAVDHMTGLTSTMRDLKSTNPDAYRRQLFSSLNIPFVPFNENPSLARAKAEIARYKGAQIAVSNAKRGDRSELDRYNLVPYGGELVQPSQVTSDVKSVADLLASRGLGGISPVAVMPRASTKPRRSPSTPSKPPQ